MKQWRSILIVALSAFCGWGLYWAVPSAQAATITIDAAGFAFERTSIDIDALNGILTEQNYPALNDSLLLHGVSSSGSFFNLFRYTAFAAGNAMTSRSESGRLSKLSVSYGGFMPEYSLVLEPDYVIDAGILLGGGRATLFLLREPSSDFADAIEAPQQNVLRRTFISFKPNISARAKITPWLRLNVSAGYLINLSGPWEQPGLMLQGPPESLNSFTIGVALEFTWGAGERPNGSPK